MGAAVSLVASAASLAVAYGQLWRHPEDLALACAAFAATFLLVHHATLAVSGSDGEVGGGDGERACMNNRRMAQVLALVLYGLACAEVWGAATRKEVAVAALASWCGAAVLLLVYLVASAGCHRSSDGIDLDNGALMA